MPGATEPAGWLRANLVPLPGYEDVRPIIERTARAPAIYMRYAARRFAAGKSYVGPMLQPDPTLKAEIYPFLEFGELFEASFSGTELRIEIRDESGAPLSAHVATLEPPELEELERGTLPRIELHFDTKARNTYRYRDPRLRLDPPE